MIDWNVLIKEDNESKNTVITPKVGQRPTNMMPILKESDTSEPNEKEGSEDSARLARLVRPKNKRVGQERANNPPVEGGAPDNYCATETYSVNPIAICLLLTCCNKATFSKEETIEAIINLQAIPQQEQIRSWAILCQKNGLDPHRVTYPFTKSPNKGTSCQGCKHIEMLKTPTDKRPVYRFVCKQQHQILEAFYVGERVLIAPESCRDYLPTA